MIREHLHFCCKALFYSDQKLFCPDYSRKSKRNVTKGDTVQAVKRKLLHGDNLTERTDLSPEQLCDLLDLCLNITIQSNIISNITKISTGKNTAA